MIELYITSNVSNIKKKFIKSYKHPYIKDQLYDNLLKHKQIYFLQELFKKTSLNNETDILFQSLLHIQCSIDIHDQVDLYFDDSISKHSLETNQLKVLVGDYHSALFYNLLTNNHLLDALYHFIATIKEINQSKMNLIHIDDLNDIDPNQLFIELEMICAGIYDSLHHFFEINDYESYWKPQIYYHLVYNCDDTPWANIINNISDEYRLMFNSRKQYWKDQLNGLECSLQ
ncbi:heptaprenyl diphosphate synthase component 1 [Bacillaceae bacterium W0354]